MLLDPLAPPDAFAPLATERLILRPLIPEDADALHRLVNDWEVTRNLAVVPFPYPRELADEWIQSPRRSTVRLPMVRTLDMRLGQPVSKL